MPTKKYAVVDGDEVTLAIVHDLEIAFAFIRGFQVTFYNEPINLRIRELVDEVDLIATDTKK